MTINSDAAVRGRHKDKKARQLHAKPILASATVLTLGLSGVLFTGGVANAAPGSSEASARYLSGNLLGTSLDNVAAVNGETARADGTTDPTVTNSGNLDLSAFGNAVNLQVRDGVTVPLTVTDAGILSQYASASQDGSSKAASGLVTDDGVIDVDRTDAAPQQLSLDLSNLIGTDLADSVANLEVSTGANTASASKTATGDPVGDYRIGDLTTTFTSPVLAGLSDRIQTAGDGVEATANGILAPDGSLVAGITDAISSLGVTNVTSTGATVDLSPTIQNVLQQNQVLGADGPVQINLANGEVTVDIQALLEANGRDLNDLAPGEDILDTEVVGFITADVDELVNGLLNQAQEAVTVALASTTVTVNATAGDPADPVLTLSADGTLADIIAGASPFTVTVTDETYDVAPLNTLFAGSLLSVLDARLDTNAIDAPLSATYPELDAVLTSLVRLQANVQENADGEFTETALRLSVLNAPTDGQALALNLAQAAVGPNVAATPDAVAPTLTSLTPTVGPEAGGTQVTITGSGFTGSTGVTFDGNDAINFNVVSDTEIVASTPAGVGVVDVAVQKTGVNDGVLTNAFTYVPAANPGDGSVISINPTAGPEAGGTSVTIAGSGFTGATGVSFGDTPAAEFAVISDNEIVATSPAGTGSVAVTVNTPAGALQSPTDFTYVPAGTTTPAITSVTPAVGPETGFTIVTIGGNGFDGATGVTFGGKDVISYKVDSDTQITVVTPAGTGVVPIVVNGANGDINSPIAYTYVPVAPVVDPTITSVTPNTGSTAGGTNVTIIGGGFTAGSNVFFDGKPASNVTVVSDTEITATTPSGSAGAVDVVITNPNSSPGQLSDGFTYVTPPVGNPNDGGNGNGGTNPTDGGTGNGGGTNGNGGATPNDGNGVSDGNGVNNGDGNGVAPNVQNDFANCTEAEAAGQSNFASTNRNLDADGDGTACETNGDSGEKRDLAYTGADIVAPGIVGGVLIALGGVLYFMRRRIFA